jgi:hypothetical protein
MRLILRWPLRAIVILGALLGARTKCTAAELDQLTVNLDSGFVQSGAVGRTEGSQGEADRIIEAAQTIKVGIAGKLERIDLWLGRQPDTSGALSFDLFDGEPTPSLGSPLYST